MILTDEQTDMSKFSMSEVVLTFPGALEIVKKYNLDFCCGGKKPFSEVCTKAGADPDLVWREIMEARSNRRTDSALNFASWDVPKLIDFILEHHHTYVRSSIPQIKQLLEKVCSVHGEDSPNLFSVSEDFDDLADELMAHMPKEEEFLFPAMKRIFDPNRDYQNVSLAQADLEMPIEVMEHEHDRAGDLIKSIRALTHGYTPPSYACPTFKMTYVMLNQFDDDLMQHIHIENNVLFPKAAGGSICNL
jgi:regulator of cell morphogenesis and NO signaling